MQWTLAQLRTFSAVAELGTMTAAAGALGYTPGAVSQHMTALQRTVGVRLLAPTGRRVALTEAGIALLPRIR
ncbi:MAG: LysR family transcriptional regulator, partial [Brevibacterium yomogidense]